MAAPTPLSYLTPEQRKGLEGKKVLVISHSKWNPNGLPAAGVANIKHYNGFFKDAGCQVYLCTPNIDTDLTYRAYLDNNLIDGVIICPEMYEDNGSEMIAKAVKEAGVEFDGIFSHFEMLQPIVGEVAERLDIKHNPASAYANARDKYATRQALEKAGVPTPKSAPIRSEADIPEVVAKLGYPMIIKPTSGAGSLGVYKAFNEDELRQGVERVLGDMSAIAYLAANPGVEQAAPMVVEQLIIPKQFGDLPVGEFDIDLVVWDGQLKYGAVTDNWKPIPPYYLENGNTFPSLVPESVQQELIDYCFACVKALGFYKGVFHMEAIYSDKGPMLIECNPRVGGGPVVENNRRLRGVELPYEHMISTLNVPVAPKPKPKAENCLVVYYVNCPRTGTLEDADFLEFLNDDPDVTRKVYFVHAGQEVKGFDTGVPMWIAEIAMEGPVGDLQRLTKKMEKAAQQAMDNVRVRKEPERRPSRRQSLLDGVPTGEKEGEKEFIDISVEDN